MLCIAGAMAQAHTVEHERMNSLQLSLPLCKLLEADFFGMFARDVDNLGVLCIFGRDVLFSQCLKKGS